MDIRRKWNLAFALALAVLLAAGAVLPARMDANPHSLPDTPQLSGYSVNGSTVRLELDACDPRADYHILRRICEEGGTADIIVTGTEYTDTGLTAGNIYYYTAIAVNGYGQQEAGYGNHVTLTPLDRPVFTRLSWRADLGAGQLEVFASWAAVPGADRYRILNNRVDGEYWREDTSVTMPIPFPDAKTKIIVTVAGAAHVKDFDYPGPSAKASFIYSPLWRFFYFEEADPWAMPYHERWLTRLLEVYGDPAEWSGGQFGSGALARLAGHMLSGQELSGEEARLAGALHPDGLALLKSLYAQPPGEAGAGVLSRLLEETSRLLAGGPPQALQKTGLARYSRMLEEMGSLAAPALAGYPAPSPSQTAGSPFGAIPGPTPTPRLVFRTRMPFPVLSPHP